MGQTKKRQYDRAFRTASRWSQFACLVVAQLSGRNSLRDIIDNMSAQMYLFYHMGCRLMSRFNLSRVNEDKPYELYEALFRRLLNHCQRLTSGHDFRFKNPLYSLDASAIDLCLSVFPLVDFHSTKGAIKLRVGLHHAGYLPEFTRLTEGNIHEVNIGKLLNFPKSSIAAMDIGYSDYGWYSQLTEKGIFFVTRIKSNAKYRVVKRHPVMKNKRLTCDQRIQFTGARTSKKCPVQLRRIGYTDAVTGKHYTFLINNFKLSAKTIADVYKVRVKVDLFFKWIKQNPKIKSFVGTSKNAMLTQMWFAMCVYLILAVIKLQSKFTNSLQQILRRLQLYLFEKRDPIALLRGGLIHNSKAKCDQMVLI